MNLDLESKKYGYSANFNLEVLDTEVASIFDSLNNGYSFLQGSASVHNAIKIR